MEWLGFRLQPSTPLGATPPGSHAPCSMYSFTYMQAPFKGEENQISHCTKTLHFYFAFLGSVSSFSQSKDHGLNLTLHTGPRTLHLNKVIALKASKGHRQKRSVLKRPLPVQRRSGRGLLGVGGGGWLL